MALSLTSLKMVAPPFDFDSGLPTVAGPYRIAAQDVFTPGSTVGAVYKAGASQSVVFVAGSTVGQVK